MTNEERIALAKDTVITALATQFTYTLDVETSLRVVGSTYIKDTTTSDIDILLTFPVSNVETLMLQDWGWTVGGSTNPVSDGWVSWKKMVHTEDDAVEVNLLVCANQDYINKWLTAAEACRFLHLQGVHLTSGSVHGVHQIIMDGSTAVDEVQRRDYL